jgi:hypothetical protein
VDETFDWDALDENDDLELWLIRAPEGVSIFLIPFVINLLIWLRAQFTAKQLERATLKPPTSKRRELGNIVNKSKTVTHSVVRVDAKDGSGAAEEMNALRCLLPRKRKAGKMFTGARHQYTLCTLTYNGTPTAQHRGILLIILS